MHSRYIISFFLVKNAKNGLKNRLNKIKQKYETACVKKLDSVESAIAAYNENKGTNGLFKRINRKAKLGGKRRRADTPQSSGVKKQKKSSQKIKTHMREWIWRISKRKERKMYFKAIKSN